MVQGSTAYSLPVMNLSLEEATFSDSACTLSFSFELKTKAWKAKLRCAEACANVLPPF